MYQNIIIAVTVIAVLIVYFGSMFIAAYAVKKKIDVSGLIEKAKAEIPVFEQVETLLVGLLPAPYNTMANTIVGWIKKAVEVAQALCDAGQLTPDQRKTKAIELINASLTMEKIAANDKVKNAISLAVDLAAILFIPNKPVAVVTQ